MQGNDRLPETIGGYRIVRRLAREATVDVLLARVEGTRGEGRTVVLKLVTPTFRGDASFEQTFARETQSLARLDHPNIVRLYDVFSATEGKVMVLEHVEGLSLTELRHALAQQREALSDGASYGVAAALFSALAAAHAAPDPQTGNLLPIVHRDVHPGQVRIGRDGLAKLGGFGVERITGVRGDTKSGEARGYLPPEKARGEAVTIRSDVYAAMLVVWELLARRRAVRDDALPEQELVRALSQPTIPSLDVLRPDLPADVRSVVARALEPQIERRAVTAEEAASIFRGAESTTEARRLLAMAVARASDGAKAEPIRQAAPSLPRLPVPSSPDLTPVGGQTPDKPGPPRPSPRRMWGSSPTFTPDAAIIGPSSPNRGSIPDARFSQEPGRSAAGVAPADAPMPAPRSSSLDDVTPPLHSPGYQGADHDFDHATTQAPPSAEELTPPLPQPPPSQRTPPVPQPPPSQRTPPLPQPPPSQRTPPLPQPPPSQRTPPPPPSERAARAPASSRTVAGGFNVASLKPLLDAPPPAPAVPPPQPLFATPAPIQPRPGEPLPGMAVPIATGATILDDMLPVAPSANAPMPPPAAEGMSQFWSAPPPAPTAPTIRYARLRKRSSLTALTVGLFLVAMAAGAGGFVWYYRRAVRSPAIATAPAASSVRSTAVRPPVATALPQSTATPTASVSALTATTARTSATPPVAIAPSATAVAVASANPSAKPAASAIEPAPKATSTTPVQSATDPKGGGAGAGMGTVRLDKRAAGHRVFIDGRVAGEGEGPFTVACGARVVRIGSKGKSQKVDVPCGGEASVVMK